MRDDDGPRIARAWVVAVMVAVAAVLRPTGRADAQRLYGQFDVQYLRTERVATGATREVWITSFETDYAHRLPQAVDLLARVRFSQQTTVGRLDRTRTPEGSLRIAHQYFGVFTEYRPSEVRDFLGVTSQQQTFTLTGYAQKPGLPSLSGSWIRSHYNSSALAPGTASVTRNLSAIYSIRRVGLRAGYGDRELEPENGLPSRIQERHGTVGATSQFQIGRAPVALMYDYTQSWVDPTGRGSQISRLHAASGNSSFQWTPKTSSGVNYTFRQAEVQGLPGSRVQDHNGGASVTHSLTRAWSASAGAGLRSFVLGGRSLTDKYVSVGTSAQGQARRGWTVGASAGRTVSWLPGDRGRTTDVASANTMARMAKGMDGRADFSISSTERPQLTDSIGGGHEIGRQASLGLTALPLRTVYLDAMARRAHTSITGLTGSTSTTSYVVTARVTPSQRFQLSGSWGRTNGLLTRSTTFQATVLWTVSSRFQASGTYSRADQTARAEVASLTSYQESFTGSASLALARDLNVSARYSDSYRGLPNEVQDWSVSLVKRFGR